MMPAGGFTSLPIASICLGLEFCGSLGISYYAILLGVSFVLSVAHGLVKVFFYSS